MIPKIFHYCWLSNEPFPEKVQRCMESWEKFLGDYNCIFWDYQKAKATGIPWILEAMEQGNWAFAADAARLYALYTEGGIYLDSDVQLLMSPNHLLDRKYILGYENGSKRIEPSFLGAEKNSPIASNAIPRFSKSAKFALPTSSSFSTTITTSGSALAFSKYTTRSSPPLMATSSRLSL